MTKRAILYARTSADDRDKGGRNLDGQLDMARDYATERGYRVVGELAEDDRGASGAEMELPQLQKILTLAEEGAIDVVIAREIDRLSRTLVKQLVVESMLRDMGVTVEYVLADYDDTPEGQLSKTIRAVISEYERLKVIERMERGKVLAVRRGRTMTHGRAPYGYRDADGTIEIDEDEAAIVRQIYIWYIDDGLGTRAIADELTERRVPTFSDSRPEATTTKTSGFGVWSQGAVYLILRNRTYMGEWQYHTGDTVSVPAIISPERWQAAQRQRRANRNDKARNVVYDYLFQHQARCAECGHAMFSVSKHPSPGRVYLYYVCEGHRPAYMVPAARADDALWQYIVNLYSPEMIDEIVERLRADVPDTSGLDAERNQLQAEIVEMEARHERLLDLYLHGSYSLDELESRRHAIDGRLVELRDKWHELTERIGALSTASPDDISALLALVRDDVLGADDFATRRAVVEELGIVAYFERLGRVGNGWRWRATLHLGDLGEIGSVEL